MEEAATLAGGGLTLILFGIALLAAVRLLARKPEPSEEGVLESGMSLGAWVLIHLGLVAFYMGALLGLGFILWIATLIVLARSLVKRRVAQQYALLWMLAVTAERLIPLTSVFEAFARERRGPLARRCRRMVKMLNGGMSLPDALERCPGLLPVDVLPVIRVGYESGALAPALRQAASRRDFHGPLWMSVASRALYLCIALLFGMATVVFVMLKIVPQFIKIFDDFDAELPMMTRLVIFAARFFGSYWWLFAPIYPALGLLFFYALFRYIGWIHWELPGTRRLVRRLHTAAILDALALAVERGRPLLDSIASLASSYPHEWIRRRLRLAAHDVYAGEDWSGSLFRHGLLGRADLAVLQAAGRVGNLPWAMKEMADSSRRRVVYRLQALVQMLFPVVILGLAAFVMFYVVAMFLPLISLIQRLT